MSEMHRLSGMLADPARRREHLSRAWWEAAAQRELQAGKGEAEGKRAAGMRRAAADASASASVLDDGGERSSKSSKVCISQHACAFFSRATSGVRAAKDGAPGLPTLTVFCVPISVLATQ